MRFDAGEKKSATNKTKQVSKSTLLVRSHRDAKGLFDPLRFMQQVSVVKRFMRKLASLLHFLKDCVN